VGREGEKHKKRAQKARHFAAPKESIKNADINSEGFHQKKSKIDGRRKRKRKTKTQGLKRLNQHQQKSGKGKQSPI